MREFQLLAHIYDANESLGESVAIPPGDDMGMIRLGGRDLLVAVDQLVGGRHYDPAATPLELIGRKSITRALSDVAAMAARPVGALVASTLPPDFGEERSTRLFDAMRATAESYGCPLVGGDISVHGDPSYPAVTAVTVLAEPGAGRPPRRGDARVGDRVCVTGGIGGARTADNLGRHLTFEPRIGEAIRLSEILGERLHAMIDLSDGLGRDVGHIAELSGVVIEIDAEALPKNPGCGWREALGDGEDYELCFTAEGDMPADVDGLPLTVVGRVVGDDDARAGGRPAGSVVVRVEDRIYDGKTFGWQHGA